MTTSSLAQGGDLFKKVKNHWFRRPLYPHMIAKCGKPHTIGETLILPAAKQIVATMLGPSASTIMQSIPLSNDTVSKRIDEMAADVEERLIDTLKNTEFVMQIDESTICENEALLPPTQKVLQYLKRLKSFLMRKTSL